MIQTGLFTSRLDIEEAAGLAEGLDDEKGELTVTVIRPGFNAVRKRFYPADTLRRERSARARAEIDRAIAESKLPDPARERLAKRFEGAESAEGLPQAIQEELDYLSGYETPQVAMKATDKSGVGSPMDGDFAHDRVVYRVRHIFGGCQLDPRYTYAQTGS